MDSVKENCKILVLDVDGTLTDGKIYVDKQGECFKVFNVKDGYALSTILPQNDIVPVIITGRESAIVENRCRELGIQHIFQNVRNKKELILGLLEQWGYSTKDLLYMGDDIPDLEGMKMAHISGCPADAVDEVKSQADYICHLKGGEGAVREFVEWYVQRKSALKGVQLKVLDEATAALDNEMETAGWNP